MGLKFNWNSDSLNQLFSVQRLKEIEILKRSLAEKTSMSWLRPGWRSSSLGLEEGSDCLLPTTGGRTGATEDRA